MLNVQEYGTPTSIKEAARFFEIDVNTFLQLLNKAFEAANQKLREESALQLVGLNAFRFVGIAGILLLNQNLRIEIIPKFLRANSVNWREDFLRIALITDRGYLTHNLPISSKPSRNLDLYEIISESWIRLFDSLNRNIIRTYVNSSWVDYTLDGESSEEELVIPSENGFIQKGILLSRNNSSNFILFSAATILQGKISNPQLKQRMMRAITLLKPKTSAFRKKLNLNKQQRANAWHPLLDLSQSIIKNNLLGFSEGGSGILPGYLIKTEQAWERLMFISVRKAFPEFMIRKQKFALGNRQLEDNSIKTVWITPDISLTRDGQTVLCIDAKYKLTEIGRKANISISDIYESIQYINVSGAKLIILLYPTEASVWEEPPTTRFERFFKDEMEIIAIRVGVNDIVKESGLKQLSANLRMLLNANALLVSN